MADNDYVPDENDLRERFRTVGEEASDLLTEVNDLAPRVEAALRQLNENLHYELWSSFCESRGDLREARETLSLLNQRFAKLNLIFAKLNANPALDAREKGTMLFEAEEEVESAEQELAEARGRYEAAQEPDPDDLPPNLD